MTVAIYSRQSVDKKDSISIESQIDFCKKETLPTEEVKVYMDKGFSGKNTDRPKFQEMMADIKIGLIEKVIVYKLDRISRNLLDFANIIEFFKQYTVSFVSCNEKFDTSTPMGNAMLSITMVFAQLERETIQKRIKDNYYARGAKGLYMGGRAPYGFIKISTRVNNKKTYTFEDNLEKKPSLLKMYELYSETDMSLGKISDYLNNEGILAAEGGAWDSGKISRILRSPVYVQADADIYAYYKDKGCILTNDISDFVGTNGCYLYGKRESNERKYTNVKDHVLSIGLHEGVIKSSTWLTCQYKLDRNKQIKNTGKGQHSWLSGIIKCEKCGYTISVVVARNKRYLSCRGKTTYKTCEGFLETQHADILEKRIESRIFIEAEKIKNNILHYQESKRCDTNESKLKLLEIDNQIDTLMDQLSKASGITMEYVNRRIASLDNERNIISSEMKKNIIVDVKTLSKEDLLKQVDNWVNLSLEDKKNVCKYFIDVIKLRDNLIDIEWTTNITTMPLETLTE
ncbi:recombinase family protein [Clostridium sp.]|uniref:recombinase family protein n=1 Tax=Clostridium sp. TaxID=1506 RepID=UPI001A5D37A9|nr:recombinase family protein [Clostridium sp.]MBK5239854.1 recombinase family protein [Clostridium sp.]